MSDWLGDMAKKHGGKSRRSSHRAVHRSATRLTVPRREEHPAEDARDQPLIQGLRQSLRDDPLAFILSVSTLLAALDVDGEAGPAADGPTPTAPELVDSFLGTDIAETTAALHVIAALTSDELTAARIRRELTSRRQPVPAVVRDLPDARVRSAAFVHDELGDGENVMLELLWPQGSEATAVIYIDHAVGTRIKDAFAVSNPMEAMRQRYRELIAEDGRGGAVIESLDLADARATLEVALAGVRHVEGDPEDTWPGSRPFVEMLLRSLPRGGTPYAGPEAYRPTEAAAVLRDFLASPEAKSLALGEDGPELDAARVLVDYAATWSGHPLRWSARTVEVALTEQLPLNPAIPTDTLDAVPDVLGPLVRYSHRVAGTGQANHQLTMEAIGWYVAEFDDVRELGPDDDETDPLGDDLLALLDGDPGPILRRHVIEVVGGEAALAALDVEPLPDEALDLSRVPEDVRPTVLDVGAWIDRWFAESPGAGRLGEVGTELRTACRRYLCAIAERDARVLRRKARTDTTAAAIVGTLGRANFLIGHPPAVVTHQEVHRWFGVSPPSQRAHSLREAFGRPPGSGGDILGDASLLTSDLRASIVAGLESLER